MTLAPSTAPPAARGRAPQAAAALTVEVAGIPIFDGDLEAVLNIATARHRAGLGTRIATANLDFLALARRDAAVRDLLCTSTVVVADGAPVAWLARLAGARRVRRIAGVDLVAALCASRDAGGPSRTLLYGSCPEIASAAAASLGAGPSAATVVDVVCPPFRPLAPEEAGEHQARIAAADPDLVLVALGFPAQERLIAEWWHVAPAATWVGIGGTLDFYAGRRRRAPRWMQGAGLEWVARLVQEPRRLWRRYFLRDLPALVAIAPRVVTSALGWKRPSAPGQGRALNGPSTHPSHADDSEG